MPYADARYPAADPCPYVTGNVTKYCTLNLSENPNSSTLTDEEREAVHWFAHYGLPEHHAATLRGLLGRLGGER